MSWTLKQLLTIHGRKSNSRPEATSSSSSPKQHPLKACSLHNNSGAQTLVAKQRTLPSPPPAMQNRTSAQHLSPLCWQRQPFVRKGKCAAVRQTPAYPSGALPPHVSTLSYQSKHPERLSRTWCWRPETKHACACSPASACSGDSMQRRLHSSAPGLSKPICLDHLPGHSSRRHAQRPPHKVE